MNVIWLVDDAEAGEDEEQDGDEAAGMAVTTTDVALGECDV
jgi:hypothetical protein